MFSDAGLAHYARNCFISIAYPIFPLARLKAIPLHHLAYELAKARSKLPPGHTVQVYKLLEESMKLSTRLKAVIPYDIRANETMVVSNMSIARIVDIWLGWWNK